MQQGKGADLRGILAQAVAQDQVSNELAFSLMAVMNRIKVLDRPLIRQLLQLKPDDPRLMRAAADLLAGPSDRDDNCAAMKLYLDIAKRGGGLWNSETMHNLASLLASQDMYPGVAFALWSKALMEQPDDQSIRRGFASFLSNQQEPRAAMDVLDKGILPRGMTTVGHADHDIQQLHDDPEISKMTLDHPYWQGLGQKQE